MAKSMRGDRGRQEREIERVRWALGWGSDGRSRGERKEGKPQEKGITKKDRER